MTSFVNKKKIRIKITLGTGKFGSSDNDTLVLEDFRTVVDIEKAGEPSLATLKAKIFGVGKEAMNSATTLQWRPGTLIPNTIEVTAIDGTAETLVFAGNIINAWGDYQSIPDVFLYVQAQAGMVNQLQPVPPRSFKGQVDVASVLQQICKSMGYVFENNGVNVQLSDVYLANTDMEQAKNLARMAGIDYYLDDTVFAITPKNTPRRGLVPIISAQSGMIGYPTYDGIGVNFATLFNPGVRFGGLVKVETDVTQAAGEWVVSSISHRLEAEKPDGAWFSQIRGTLNGLAVVRL